MSKIDGEIFDDKEQAIAVMWWLLHLLGGRVVIPTEPEFWLTNFPSNTWVALREEDGRMVLVAEQAESVED